MSKQITKFGDSNELKAVLAHSYQKQIENFFGDNKKALEFLSNVIATTQKVPELLECTPVSLINSFITMAQLKLMPSSVSGEAYVLPYKNKKAGIVEAQFQLGYQGLVTLFYRANVEKIVADIIRQNDKSSLVDGEIKHEIDITLSREERGKAIGAYVKITYRGAERSVYMNGKDILAHGKKFSKSFNSEYSPWNEDRDPELWMWKKTVLKQASKLLPKNEVINQAISADNKDSFIGDRLEPAIKESESLKMSNLLIDDKKENSKKETTTEVSETPESDQEEAY